MDLKTHIAALREQADSKSKALAALDKQRQDLVNDLFRLDGAIGKLIELDAAPKSESK